MQKAANQIKEKGARKVRKAAGRAIRRAVSVLFKATIKLLLLLVKLFPVLLVVALFVSLAYFVSYEIRGVSKIYDFHEENEVVDMVDDMDDDGAYVAKELGDGNQLVLDFYKYFSLKSVWEVDVDKKDDPEALKRENLISPDDTKKFKKDYYNRDRDFLLTPDLLFALDNVIFDETLRYPEQFIKPVAYDEKEFKLKDIADDSGNVIVESKERDLDTGAEKGKFNSITDYGLATVLKLREMKERTLLKGVYFKEDYYDPMTGTVMQKDIQEPFEIELPKKTEKHYILENAVTVAGNVEYTYETGYELREIRKEGESANEKDNVNKILSKVIQVQDPLSGEIKDVYLYKYRDDSSGMYQEVEVPAEPNKEDKGLDYYNDYLMNFKIYLPKEVLIDIRYRINYKDLDRMKKEYGEIDEKNKQINAGSVNIDFGTSSDSSNVVNSMQYFDIVAKHADTFGVDPYVLLAMIAQESGGNANAKGGGLLQIVGGTSVTATGKNGKETLRVHDPYNVEDSIKFGAMRLKANLDKYNGNYFLAIMAHNMGEGTVGVITQMYKDKLKDNSWVNPYDIEKARLESIRRHAPKYINSASAGQGCFKNGYDRAGVKQYWGDTCYLWNVLRYYAGNNPDIKSLEGTGGLAGNTGNVPNPDTSTGESSSSISGGTTEKKGLLNKVADGFVRMVNKTVDSLTMMFKDAINTLVKKYNEPYPLMNFEQRMGFVEAEEIRILAKSYKEQILYSKAFDEDPENPSLFDEGFMENYSGAPNGAVGIGGYGGAGVYYGEGGFVPPLESYRVSSKFGYRYHPTTGKYSLHAGIDLAAPSGTPVMAAGDGTVKFAGEKGTYGNVIFITHAGGIETRYAHLSRIATSTGKEVKAGEIIGYVGSTGRSTGPHLHFEYRVGGSPVDPTPIVKGEMREKRDPSALANSMGLSKAPNKASEIAIDFALEQAKNNVPYGRQRGFDCSSLILNAYQKAGLTDIPQTTSAWVKSGKMMKVNSISDLKPGDAIICSNDKNPTGHIIMYLGNNKYVHASSTFDKVVVDSFETNSYHRSRLRLDLVFRPR